MIEVDVIHRPTLFLNRGVLGSVAFVGDIDEGRLGIFTR
jgi:hypothetical protein